MKNFLLCDAAIKKNYTILNLCHNIDIKTKTRLLEFGFFQGQTLTIINKSLRKGVLLIEIANQLVTLRTLEAACVVVYG